MKEKRNLIIAILLSAFSAIIIYLGLVKPPLFLKFFGDGEKGELVKIEKKISETQIQIESLKNLTPEELEERKRRQEALSAISVAGDVFVQGVLISKEGGRKIIKNSDYGYTIELPANLILARSVTSDLLEFHDQELLCGGDPSCPAVIEILARDENPEQLPLEAWFEKNERMAGDEIYSPREPLTIGGLNASRVTENIPRIFDGFYYYFSRDNFIYSIRVAAADDPGLLQFVNTFRFE